MVYIGVTGHRFLTDINKIVIGINKAFNYIKKHFNEDLIIISSLAEGADRLAVKVGLDSLNAKFIVPLPMEKSDYLKDFKTKKSKEEFFELLKKAEKVLEIPKSKYRDHSYKIAGIYILENCDVLIAVWDGKLEQGIGGTADIVKIAREKKIPLAIVYAGNRKPGTNEYTTLGKKQGKVTYERFPNKENN